MGRTPRVELERDDIRITTIIPGGFATNLVRGFDPATLARLGEANGKLSLDMSGPDARKVLGDPVRIAATVKHIFELPIKINFEEITIRPPISIGL